MDVFISEVIATALAVSGDAVLSERTLEKIVKTVLNAIQAQRASEERAKKDRRIASGACCEPEGEN